MTSLRSNGVSNDILNVLSLLDADIIGKSVMFSNKEHFCIKSRPNKTTLAKFPITDIEQNQFRWQAESALRLYIEFVPTSKITVEHLLIIAVVSFREIEFGQHVAMCQSIYKKR